MPANINFEDEPKHDITEQMLYSLKSVALKQDEYGLSKYEKPLDHTFAYNWLEMALEEAADGLKYIQCEINRRNDVIALLKSALRVDEPKTYIESALEILMIRGTGK
ncbi:hypothetical protein BKM15_25820 [Pseudomonas syringae pv. syringae]|nr:hypothetical protein BKM15_25820 [Pseudomonas syringae pv. syringae]